MELTVTTNSANSLTVTTNITEIDVKYTAPQYRIYTDGTTVFRTGSRDDTYILDKELTATGFDGVEGPGDGTGDWENIEDSQ